MGDYWFVDEDHTILVGEAAQQTLESISDHENLSSSHGISSISQKRWEIAQSFEKKQWMAIGAHSKDDRNFQHMLDFDNYNLLSGRIFNHAIELGCGPFTNLRLIGQVCKITQCTLLDPLIESYLQHPNCSYDRRVLHCADSSLAQFLSTPKFFRFMRRIIRHLNSQLLYENIPVQNLVASSIEKMPTNGLYDLIVMVNVIEHCYDANLVLENILKIASPNAIFVFHDKYYDHQIVSQMVNGHYYDAGHPLMVDRKILDEFMINNFDNLFLRRSIKRLRNPVMPEYEDFFFIGKIRAHPPL